MTDDARPYAPSDPTPEQVYEEHDAGLISDEVEAVEAISGIDLMDHALSCPTRPPHTSWRWWLCPTCERNVDTFGGNVL